MTATLIRISVQAGRLDGDGRVAIYDLEIIKQGVDDPLGLSSFMRILLTIMAAILVVASFVFIGHAAFDHIAGLCFHNQHHIALNIQ